MSEYLGDERRDVSWHVEKKLSISHMISTIVLAGAVIGVYRDMDTRQVRVEAAVHQLEKESDKLDKRHNSRMDRIRVEQKEAVQKVDKSLNRINEKLDRLIEREIDHNGHLR